MLNRQQLHQRQSVYLRKRVCVFVNLPCSAPVMFGGGTIRLYHSSQPSRESTPTLFYAFNNTYIHSFIHIYTHSNQTGINLNLVFNYFCGKGCAAHVAQGREREGLCVRFEYIFLCKAISIECVGASFNDCDDCCDYVAINVHTQITRRSRLTRVYTSHIYDVS